MKTKKETLEKRLESLKIRLREEETRLTRICNGYGWGHAMRCVKCTPSFRKSDELKEKIQIIESLLKSEYLI